MQKNKKLTLHFEEVGIEDVALVGGKNASLGEMISELGNKGIRVPTGFVVTAYAYRYFLEVTGLKDSIKQTLSGLNTKDLENLSSRGKKVREMIKKTEMPEDLREAIKTSYKEFSRRYSKGKTNAVDVAVRSSATAEDLPGASFAGEHETYLNIKGEKELLEAVRAAMASLFTDRAISYRVDKGFDHFKIALSVGVQKMVRSDKGCSGVMFSIDTESGFKDTVLINGAWGLGELIVQGEVTPDEFLVFKGTFGKAKNPIISKKLGVKNRKFIYASNTAGIKNIKLQKTNTQEFNSFILSDKEILTLAKWAIEIEAHYSKKRKVWTPMDMEWAKDGITGELFIVQARPETIHAGRNYTKLNEYVLLEKGKVITKGASVGNKIASGPARVILSAKEIHSFKKGEVLITDMTDPDWEPIMKIASAIVTNKGGRTSHAAIVSRELGIPCVVGTENATSKIKTGDSITVDVSGSEGLVYAGKLKFKVVAHDVSHLPKPKTKIMMNIATPDTAFEKSFLPNEGVGLAREEFIASEIGMHPMALVDFQKLKKTNPKLADKIEKRTIGYSDKSAYYVEHLAYGIAKIGAAFYPKKVIVRFSDFKTNEYRTLLGGELYEPMEENPMIGFRGASRYYNPAFAKAFMLECKAIKKVREEMGLTNVVVMVPFCRTVEEGKKVLDIMRSAGLDKKKDKTLLVYVMCEIPSNVILAEEFLEVFDGMSIGSNDLTQLTLGIDRDGNQTIHDIANETDESVKALIEHVIYVAKMKKKYIGICGQGPSDIPAFAEFLVHKGIESMSLNPDTVIATTERVYKVEKKLK